MIFIFIAIFAALTYAVSTSFQVGDGEAKIISDEKMRLAYTEIHSVVQEHRAALQKMIMIDKIPYTMLDGGYSDGGVTYNTHESSCLTDACRLYAPTGGGLKWYKFPEIHPDLTPYPGLVTNWPSNFTHGIFKSPVSGEGTTRADPIYFLAITRDFCVFINKQLGITVDIDSTEDVTIATNIDFNAGGDGWTEVHGASFTGPGQGQHLRGRKEGCYKNGTNYSYFALLYAR